MSDLRLRLTRVLDAPVREVWRALTEPDRLATWWGPAGFTAPRIWLDLRAGGSYRIEMQPPDGGAFYLQGEFREVAPPARLAYTFRWEDPDPDDRDTVVTLALAEVRAGTELVIEQGPFLTDARLALHRSGWSESCEKLSALASSLLAGEVSPT